MPDEPAIKTNRLLLRTWRAEDLPAFAALNADERVMEFMPRVLSTADSHATAERIVDHFTEHGCGLWAVEAPGVADFVGFVGLNVPKFETDFTPCIEIGWRLAYQPVELCCVSGGGNRDVRVGLVWRCRRVEGRIKFQDRSQRATEHQDEKINK